VEDALWTTTNRDAGFRTEELKPGDQIWFKNRYYSPTLQDEWLKLAKQYAAAHDKSEQWAKNQIAGEGGSNLLYIGGGRVMSIYTNEVYTIAGYQEHMQDWFTVKAAIADGKQVHNADFQIKTVRRVKDPSTI
jgi:hypothetical protein